MELHKHKAQAPLLLAENLGQVRMQYAKFKVQYEIYCTIVSVVEYREIFQVYNNLVNRVCDSHILSADEWIKYHHALLWDFARDKIAQEFVFAITQH